MPWGGECVLILIWVMTTRVYQVPQPTAEVPTSLIRPAGQPWGACSLWLL